MPEDIIFRLSPGGGPPPEAELLFHAQRALEYGYKWVGLRRSMNAARIECGRSRLYLITSAGDALVDVAVHHCVVGVKRSSDRPNLLANCRLPPSL
jgi:hypothetical protein